MKKRGMAILFLCLLLLAFHAYSLADDPDQPETFVSGRYTYTVQEDGSAAIAKFSADGEHRIEIPEELDGHPVTAIGKSAFQNCTDLHHVSIPDAVTVIGNSAFSGCSLYEIVLPGSLTEIGDYAFAANASMEGVTIPAGVERIGRNPFRRCYQV